MPSIYQSLKSLALRRLPRPILNLLKSRHYRRALTHFNEDDEPDMKIVRLLVQPGSTAVDVGANVGIYTKLLSSLVGPGGRVVSIEPVPDTYKILTGNVRDLGLRNASPINAAASDSEGVATMVIPDYPTGGENFYEASIASSSADAKRGGVRSVNVRTITLDRALASETSISFIKIDVEGHESACLSGAMSVLADQHPALLVEISGNPDDAAGGAAALFARLDAIAYRPWLLSGTTLRPRRAGDRSTNYFFLTAEQVDRLRVKAPAVVADY